MTRAKTETIPWDVQDHLRTDEDQKSYLEAAFEDGDPTLIIAALGDIAKARGMTAVAETVGMSRTGLYKALGPEGDPRLSTLLGVCKALGVRLSATVAAPPTGSTLPT